MTIFTVNLWLSRCGSFFPFEGTVLLGLFGLFVTLKLNLASGVKLEGKRQTLKLFDLKDYNFR